MIWNPFIKTPSALFHCSLLSYTYYLNFFADFCTSFAAITVAIVLLIISIGYPFQSTHLYNSDSSDHYSNVTMTSSPVTDNANTEGGTDDLNERQMISTQFWSSFVCHGPKSCDIMFESRQLDFIYFVLKDILHPEGLIYSNWCPQ